jgi:crossover junction endodeoxyribonuclease RuvC
MKIMGIDPGMQNLGLGLIELDGESIELINYGLIYHPQTAEKFNDHLDAGIAQIVNDFPKYLHLAQPAVIVSEYVPAGKLGSNDSLVTAAITTCKVIAFQFGVEWYSVAASTVKKGLTGDHRATKAKVRNAVIEAFPEIGEAHALEKQQQKQSGEKATGIPQDVFDAIAIASIGGVKWLDSVKGKQLTTV